MIDEGGINPGREDMWESTVGQHERRLLGIARKVVGSAYAEDMVQDVWVKMLEMGQDLSDPRLRGYLNAVTYTTSVDHQRHHSHSVEPETEDYFTEIPDRSLPAAPEACSLNGELMTAELKALSALPEKQRDAVVLHIVRDLSIQDVATILDEPENTVKSQCFRGLSHLREPLLPYKSKEIF